VRVPPSDSPTPRETPWLGLGVRHPQRQLGHADMVQGSGRCCLWAMSRTGQTMRSMGEVTGQRQQLSVMAAGHMVMVAVGIMPVTLQQQQQQQLARGGTTAGRAWRRPRTRVA